MLYHLSVTSKSVVLALLVGAVLSPTIAFADDHLLVTSNGAIGTGNVGEYTLSGATVNASLISSLAEPVGLAVSGSNLFVLDHANGNVVEYTSSGAFVKVVVSGLGSSHAQDIAASGTDLFITDTSIREFTTSGTPVSNAGFPGVNNPFGITASGSDLFIINRLSGGTSTIGEYTTSGDAVNASLITGLIGPIAIAVSGTDLFIANQNGTVGEYTTSGVTVNTTLISGLNNSTTGIAVSGSDLFVAVQNAEVIGEYTTSGATVNASFITGLSGNFVLTIETIPEPTSLSLLAFGAVSLLFRRRCGQR